MDYPERKPSLTELLRQHSNVLAFSGENLGVTDIALHQFNPDINPVYIPAYRLPRSQRTIVDNMVKDMLEQGVIRESLHSGTLHCFSFPKKEGHSDRLLISVVSV